jgi:RNA polymerase sigma factor (sigma-70 family)
VIHDRYRARLLAYVRQMLPAGSADAEDALQDVFLRTYSGLRASERELALRPWLYRVAHNRCIDELRRPPLPELSDRSARHPDGDPAVAAEQRESLRRLVQDIGRLPEQQRSALLMRELSGMSYADVADALGISVQAVKSLLVRARIGLAQSIEARDAVCVDIHQELAAAHDRGVRPSWMARRHLRDCPCCRAFRSELHTSKRQFAALLPALGPFAILAKVFGIGAGAGGGSATAAGAGGVASGVAGVTATHFATMLAAAVVTAGGAVELQQTVEAPGHSKPAVHHSSSPAPAARVTTAAPTVTPTPSPAPVSSSSPTTHAKTAVSLPSAAARRAPTRAMSAAKTSRPTAEQLALNHPLPQNLAQATETSSTTTTCAPSDTACPADPSSTGSATTETTTGTASGTGSTSTTAPSGTGMSTPPPSGSGHTITPS